MCVTRVDFKSLSSHTFFPTRSWNHSSDEKLPTASRFTLENETNS